MTRVPNRRFIHNPPPELAFRCGFDPNRKSYHEYVQHIRFCTHHDCDRRYSNHLLMLIHFERKYGAESGTIPANADTPQAATHSQPRASGHQPQAQHDRRNPHRR